MAEVTAFRHNALPYPIYGQPWVVVFPLLDADGDPISPSSPDSEKSLNGDTFADCTNEAVEIDTSTGICYLLLTAAEITADIVGIRIQSTGAKTTVLTLYPRKLVSIRAGTSASAGSSTSTIVLDASASAVDDFYNGMVCVAVIDGTTEVRMIGDYVGSTQTATISGPDWITAPDNNDTFTIYLPEGIQIHQANLSGAVSLSSLAVSGTTTLTGNVSMAAGLTITQSSSNASALVVTGNGTGNGATFTSGSGATGDGIKTISAATNGDGITGYGTGTGDGAMFTGGSTGRGLHCVGGSAGGAGAEFAGTLDANGINAYGNGTGDGIEALGGSGAHGVHFQGGVGAGASGMKLQAGGGTGLVCDTISVTSTFTASITGSLSGSVGSVTGSVGSVTGAVGSVGGNVVGSVGSVAGNVTGSIGSLATQAKADVNAEVVDCLNVDTYAEPSSVPAATSSLVDKIRWLFTLGRNKRTQTSTTELVRNDTDAATIGTSTKSDDGTTLVRGEFS